MDHSTALQPGTVALEPPSSVVIPNEHENISGGGPALSEKDDSGSIQSVLEAELKTLKEADANTEKAAAKVDDQAKGKDEGKPDDRPAKADDKAEKPEKARAEDGKFAKAAEKVQETDAAAADKGATAKGATGQDGSERRTSEGRHPEPPARFLPEARAKWANVPNEVKAEFHRVAQELEQESQQFRSSHERYATLKPFDDLARSNGRDLRESLTKVNEIENALQQNPIAGLDAVLREVGPRKQDGSPLTIMDVAQYLTQNPQAYQPSLPVAQAQQQNPEIEQLKAIVFNLQAQQAHQMIAPAVQAFAESRPDFDELAPRIATILEEGIVDRLYGTGLTQEQKLSEAYRMAGGQAPSSRSDTETAPAHSEATPERPVNPDAGKKSVRGAPTDGFDPTAEDPDSSIEDLLRKELRRTAARG